MGPTSADWYPCKKRNTQEKPCGDGAETGVTWPQARAARSWKKQEGPSPGACGGAQISCGIYGASPETRVCTGGAGGEEPSPLRSRGALGGAHEVIREPGGSGCGLLAPGLQPGWSPGRGQHIPGLGKTFPWWPQPVLLGWFVWSRNIVLHLVIRVH